MPTLSSALAQSKSWIRDFVNIVLGPWPIRPLPFMLFVIAGLSLSQSIRGIDEALTGGVRLVWLAQFPETALVAFGVASPLWISEWVRRSLVRKPMTRGWYLTSLVVAALVYPFIVFTFLTPETWSITNDFDLLAWTALRGLTFLLAFMALLGVSQRRFALQVQRANEATAAVLSQKELLVRSEEASRRSVADFLHDRVQSMLVTSTMQLREIAKRTDEQTGAELRSVATHLDDIRATEVREANTRLSPNIAVVGLETALRQLLASLSNDLSSEVVLDPELSTWATPSSGLDLVPLGVFRIIEQAAANAVIHGHASRVDVVIQGSGADVVISIVDNGRGLPHEVTPGSGTAISESWAEILGATWTRSNRPEGGVEVLVRLPTRRS